MAFGNVAKEKLYFGTLLSHFNFFFKTRITEAIIGKQLIAQRLFERYSGEKKTDKIRKDRHYF